MQNYTTNREESALSFYLDILHWDILQKWLILIHCEYMQIVITIYISVNQNLLKFSGM